MTEWGKNISYFRPPDLHPLAPRITAQGRQSISYFPQEHIKRCQHRGLMLAVLWQAAVDYHLAKNKLKAKRVKTENDYRRLEKWDREVIDDGKLAWEWFTKEPAPSSSQKYAYKDICAYFKVNPEKLWRQIKKTPEIGLSLMNLRQSEAVSL